MTTNDDNLPGDDGNQGKTATRLRGRRYRVVAAGVAGLAVLGGGAYLIADNAGRHEQASTTSLAPPATASASADSVATADSVGAAEPSPSSSAVRKPPSSPAPTAAAGTEATTKTAAEQVAEARKAAAKAGYPVQRGFTAAPDAPKGPVKVTNTGSLRTGGTMRVVTAKHDLSGQRELLWAADKGEPVGNAQCTQKFHFSNKRKAAVRPTMLLCWRTSKQKSVITVAITVEGKPSSKASVAEIDKQWARL